MEQHCVQTVADYAKLLIAKMELMVERDGQGGCFNGNSVFSRLLVEPSDLLQALAVLLNFGERLMPFALRIVEPSVVSPSQKAGRSGGMGLRLYLGAILAVLDESWLLLCSISIFVKNLLCQVHGAKKQCEEHYQGVSTGHADSDSRPAWLQLSLHLLAAQPRFVWFHTSVCEFVAQCHRLRSSGDAPELGSHIPTCLQAFLTSLQILASSSRPTAAVTLAAEALM
jgi:hypothetical protein